MGPGNGWRHGVGRFAFPKASSMLGFSFSWLTAWGASCFERWCADGVGEGKGRERKGKERKGRERKGKKGKGKKKMQPTNHWLTRMLPFVNGDDYVETHGYAVTQNTFLQ